MKRYDDRAVVLRDLLQESPLVEEFLSEEATDDDLLYALSMLAARIKGFCQRYGHTWADADCIRMMAHIRRLNPGDDRRVCRWCRRIEERQESWVEASESSR